MRVGVAGHVEVVELALADRVPGPGEIAHAASSFVVPGGGGAIAAVVMAEADLRPPFWTAVGDDAVGDDAVAWLQARGVEVGAQRAAGVPTRRGFCHLTPDNERTITVIGQRLAPAAPLQLGALDGVYVTAADAALLRDLREAARVVVATPRTGTPLAQAGVAVDVLVGSDGDPGEDLDPAWLGDHPPAVVVRTRGGEGGVWEARDGSTGRWDATPLPGPPLDAFGCGDAFAAILTVAVARGATLPDACAEAARAGAHRLTLRGPYGTPS